MSSCFVALIMFDVMQKLELEQGFLQLRAGTEGVEIMNFLLNMVLPRR